MPVNFTAPYKTRVKQAVADPHLSGAVTRGTVRMDTARINALGAVDGQRLRDQVRQMKEFTLRNLPELLEQLERNLIANGARVHWAKDAAEANRIISAIAEQNNVRKVVKAKSMATEEIHLNKALERVGIEVVETDLGEYIVQLAGEAPSHIVAPVMHKRIQEISELFQQKLDMPPSLDPADMCTVARRKLRKEFLSAEMGVSGCNFAIAETGTVCIVTNEGNYGNPISREATGPWQEFDRLLAEPFIRGRELTTAVLGGPNTGERALMVTELRPKSGFYDFDAKYTDGMTEHVCPAQIPDEITAACKAIALRAHQLLGCKGTSRSDFRWDDEKGVDGLFLLEVNTQPGMTPLSLVPEQAKHMGMDYPALVEAIIAEALADAKAREDAS